MKINRDTVISWLDRQRRSKSWLAEKCGVSKQAVSNWLNESNEISKQGQIMIRALMEEDAAREQARPAHHLVLDFDDDEFDAIEQAALKKNETARQWAKRSLNEIAGQDAEALVADLRRGNDFGPGSTEPGPRHLNEPTQSVRTFPPPELRDE